MKNFHEMFYIINLQILYIIALYDNQEISVITFNILFGIAAVHFILTVVYHTITYSCNNTFRTKIQSRVTTLSGWITRCSLFSTSYNQKQSVHELWGHNTRNEIPEAVNYHSYQESLLNEQY